MLASCLMIVVLTLGPTSSSTYDFVVSTLVIDSSGTSPAAGFDFDGACTRTTDSTGCAKADRISDVDSDQNYGGCSSSSSSCRGCVDNVLPVLADTIDNVLTGIGTPVRNRLSRQVATGHLLMLVRVEGVDSLTNDSDVVVSLYDGYSADSSCSSLFSGLGQYYIGNDSLTVSGNPSFPAWQAHGAIVNGRLQVRYGTSSTRSAEAPMGSAIYQLSIRATLSSSGDAGGDGNAGAWVSGFRLRDFAAAAYPRLRSILNGVMPQIDDLPNLTTSACGGDFGYPVGDAGVGLRFALVHASIIGTADSRPSGTCGAGN